MKKNGIVIISNQSSCCSTVKYNFWTKRLSPSSLCHMIYLTQTIVVGPTLAVYYACIFDVNNLDFTFPDHLSFYKTFFILSLITMS